MFYNIFDSVLNVKALVAAFNQEKALVGAFFVIVKSSRTFVWSSIYQTAGISVGLRLLRKQGQWQMQKSKRRIKYQNLPTFWTGLTQCV